MNVQAESKLNEISEKIQNNKNIINTMTTYFQIYAQQFTNLKFDHEQKIVEMEKRIKDNIKKNEIRYKKLDDENQQLFSQLYNN